MTITNFKFAVVIGRNVRQVSDDISENMTQLCILAPNIVKRSEWNETELEIPDNWYLRRLSTKVVISNTEGEDCTNKVSRLECLPLISLSNFRIVDFPRVQGIRCRFG